MHLRQTLRNLARTSGFSLTVVLVMALGVGATAALFTVVNSVLLKPLPLPDSDRLVRAWEATSAPGHIHVQVAGGTWGVWREQNHSFEQMAIANEWRFNMAGERGQLPEHLVVEFSTWQALPLLGVQPTLGRLFTSADDVYGANKTVILSWSFWKRRFAGSPGILGQKILLDTQPYTVIGVLPQWFSYPSPRTQLWVTLNPLFSPTVLASHSSHNFEVIGKLKPGITLAAAQDDLSRISYLRAQSQPPNDFIDQSAHVSGLLDADTYRVRTVLNILFAATGCLQLIACLNIANLLVARSASRRRELAIRSALGGSRGRLLLDRLMESMVLCVFGGVFGILFAQLALQWLVSRRDDLPRVESIHLDATALGFALLVALACGLLAGLAPDFADRHDQLLSALQDQSRAVSGSRRSLRFRRALLTIEVALTVVLLIGAGLFLRSYRNLRSTAIGVSSAHTLTLSLNMPYAPEYQKETKLVSIYEQILTRLQRLPGVRAAGFASSLPGQGGGSDQGMTVAEMPRPQGSMIDVEVRFVSPNYFRDLGIPLLRGRTFTGADRLAHGQLAIVSQSFAREYLGSRDPIGLHLRDSNTAPNGITNDKNEVVGVVGDVHLTSSDPIVPIVYFPLWTGVSSDPSVFIRTAGDPFALATTVQKLVASVDPSVAVTDILSYDDLIGKNTADANFNATLLSVFAGLSLVLASVGLFGVLSFLVTMRTSEIGIRMALGAHRQHVLRLLLADGLQPAVVGLMLGIAASAGLTRVLASLLYSTQPLDPIVFALVSLALIIVAALACLLPAWKASRIDPMQALRNE
ncbi:putative ABC transport system permease protein [Silvibacterium bohemicum]|uniref:Putative ABC transport system permease protein n=1 Tax=Silvibacterium bohemicum TaxID=1577686 RepID=A0A841JV75_9BACT|nr:ABC transporter permease [Silvibacterium bohemicum]MBB6145293.1 putative ABC transport system permease protein [Silvibacterium bohemicum]